MDLICMIDVEIDETSSHPRKESVQNFFFATLESKIWILRKFNA